MIIARPSTTLLTRQRRGIGYAILLGAALSVHQGCEPTGHYNRLLLEDRADSGSDGPDARLDGAADSGMAGSGGSGGNLLGTGGAGTGGVGTGGRSASGGATPGTGGAASGGINGTATGGSGGGTGGSATGGSGTGGAGTGGAGTGGRGTGGSGSGGSGPRIISIDFVGGQAVMTPSEVAGVKPAANWNSAAATSGALSALVEEDGRSTTAAVTWDGVGGVYRLAWADAPGDTRMMNGYLDPFVASAPAQVKVTGLPAELTAGGYDVYVYVYSQLNSGTRHSNYTIGSTTVSTSETGPSATSFNGYTLAPNGGAGNYIVFRKVTGSSFTFTAAPGSASGTSTRAPVNGMQIVYPSGS